MKLQGCYKEHTIDQNIEKSIIIKGHTNISTNVYATPYDIDHPVTRYRCSGMPISQAAEILLDLSEYVTK